ncbi:MAG: DNA mismatch repair protein MutL [Chlamydiae bacterium]|nr:DNA mismatch repair protein MutL [Chlamydiota bacterium]
MSSTIRILSDEVINQIAAGEVVESPASVVKELIENALDAGAKKISVEIAGGGLKLVRVIDDGMGMSMEDALLSLTRHATSKMRGAEDLFTLLTKGFRGEALASIASVSKMTMITAVDGKVGTKLEVEKGEVLKRGSSARTRGTSVEVRSLFFNVPARKKFQKTAAAISAEIFRTVTVMALCHPHVAFSLTSNGRKGIQTQSNGLRERAEEMLGKEFTGGCYPVLLEEGTYRVEGLIGAPMNSRINKLGQYLFLNDRAVVSSSIAEAVRAGYGTRIDVRRHPVFLLYISAPTEEIDVNVHPQKLHVRLKEEEHFCSVVERAIRESLNKPTKPIPRASEDVVFKEPKFESVSFRLQEEASSFERELPIELEIDVLGLFAHYLLVKEEEGLLLVDLKAARSRVLFEHFLNREKGKRESQALLLPISVFLTPVEVAMILTHQSAIEALGFSLRPIEKERILVEALPPQLESNEVEGLLTQMAEGLQEFIGKIDYEAKRREVLAKLLSGASGNRSRFSSSEGRELFKRLQRCSDPHHSPKGHSTMVQVTNDTIEALFRENQKAANSS